jgi:hypothetical protein
MTQTKPLPAIGIDDRKWLLAAHDPAVTVYRTSRAKDEELLKALEQRLHGYDIEPDQRHALLASAKAALDSSDLATGDMVLFLTEDRTLVRPMVQLAQDEIAVGQRFLLRPVLGLLGPEDRFHILAMSAGSTRLIDATRDGWREATPPGVPRSIDEVAALTDTQTTRQASPSGRGGNGGAVSATPHSYESPEELHKAQLLEHVRRVGKAVQHHLAGDTAPVVLVAESEVAGHLRKLNHWAELLPDFVSRNPAGMSGRSLHEAAVALLPSEDAEAEPVLDRIRARLGTAESNVAIKLEEILAAARDGRIDSLVFAADQTIWGHFDERKGTVAAKGTDSGSEEDLLNLAAVMTMESGGRAFGLPRDKLPRQVPAAATLRY